MNAVDEFVLYDNIEFTKKGWINRNRILVNGTDSFLTLPLKKDSDYLDIVDRKLAETWPHERQKILNRLTETYRKAPYFNDVFPIVSGSLRTNETNLFKFLFSTLSSIKDFLSIKTPFVVSSSVDIDHTLRSEEKLLALCHARRANKYINPIGGVELYSKANFNQHNIDLFFLKADNILYPQFSHEFVPFLSIIDVMMFNSKEQIQFFLNQYTIQ